MSPDDSSRADFFGGKRATALLAEFDPARTPTHVAIIMDGNGRWAAKRGLPRLAGHRAGAKAVRETIAAAIELGIGYLTIYSFSSENWSRPRDEVSGLMTLFVEVLERELANLERLHVRVRVIGDTDGAADSNRRGVRSMRRAHRGQRRAHARRRAELRRAGPTSSQPRALSRRRVQRRARTRLDRRGRCSPSRLSTAGLPDPDLVIRTSGEMRISNFLLWEIAYSELWVTATLWPDFSRTDLLKAVVDFQKRARRFGGTDA